MLKITVSDKPAKRVEIAYGFSPEEKDNKR